MKSRNISILAVVIIILEVIGIMIAPQMRLMIWKAQYWEYTANSWSITWTDPKYTAGIDLAIDSEDNLYVIGKKGLDNDDIRFYLIKYNVMGEMIWEKKYC